MACTLRAIHHHTRSIRLKTAHNTYTSNPIKILEVFCFNLAKLYSPPQEFDLTKADALFSHISPPTLNQDQQDLLEHPITDTEVTTVIKALKPHKMPGTAGFSASYYKQFSPILTPMLTSAFNSLLGRHSFRSETLTSINSLLPKPKSDTSSWTNYRPISLLNLVIKLLAKILATHLNTIIGQLMHRYQTGFIPIRQAGDSVRRPLLLSHPAKSRRIPTYFLSLDIRKAFDSVPGHVYVTPSSAGVLGTTSCLGSPLYVIVRRLTLSTLVTNRQCLTFREALDRVVPFPRCYLPYSLNL